MISSPAASATGQGSPSDETPLPADPAALRPGETVFSGDEPGEANGADLCFIGRVRSDWRERADCPKNVSDARARGGGPALVEIAPRYRAALADLQPERWMLLLTWLDRARRDLALQRPRHAERPLGTFSLRSPVRPNPIGVSLVRIVAIDAASGVLTLDAVDVLDGTPVLDLKPFLATVDVPPADRE